MSYPYGTEYDGYRWLCLQETCARLLGWEAEKGDFYLPPGAASGSPEEIAVVFPPALNQVPAGSRFYPRLDQLKIRCQRRLNTSWRLIQERFEQWMVEQSFFETEEEAWLRFLCHLHEVEAPPSWSG